MDVCAQFETEAKSLLQIFLLEHSIGRFSFLNYETKASLKYKKINL